MEVEEAEHYQLTSTSKHPRTARGHDFVDIKQRFVLNTHTAASQVEEDTERCFAFFF